MFAINNKTDYGMLLVSELKGSVDFVPLSKLIKKTKLPKRFVARIASDLVKGGVLDSREGKIGGYRLTKNLKNLSLFEFLKIFESDLELVKCNAHNYDCKYSGICKHRSFFADYLVDLFKNELKKVTLKEVLK